MRCENVKLFLRGPLDGGVRFCDDQVKRLLDRLEALGFLGDALIVVVSDHGESIGEHRYFDHALNLYEPDIRIPLMIRDKTLEPRRIAEQVGLADVMPTILGLLGLPVAAGIDGASLVPDGEGHVQGDRQQRPGDHGAGGEGSEQSVAQHHRRPQRQQRDIRQVRCHHRGGRLNTAWGYSSFAAGREALAAHDYSFVWNDRWSEGASTAANQVRFYFGGNGSTCYVDAANTTWNCSSDRSLKENFVEVDGIAILAALTYMPVFEYNMKDGDGAVRHIGPVSQDFHAAFGLGGDDKTLSSGDAIGVTMAAVQGLYTLLQEKEAAIEAQAQEVEALRTQVARFEKAQEASTARNGVLESRLDRLEQALTPTMARMALEETQ